MSRVLVSGGIRRQIAKIWARTAQRRGEPVARWAVSRIWDVISLLEQQPMVGVAGNCGGKPMRRFLAGDYWIYDSLGEGTVRIRQVTHFRRRQSGHWGVPENEDSSV